MPKITPFSLGDDALQIGQFLTLSCAVTDGDLPLDIYWMFNGQPVTNEADIIIAKLGRRSSVLTIENVNGRHAGNISCQARNAAGSSSFSTQLKVIGVYGVLGVQKEPMNRHLCIHFSFICYC